jgi:uncharacterized membrane protein AbrB (regulator of aidB expression)
MSRHPNVPRSIVTWLILGGLTWFTGSYAERHGLPAAHLLLAVLWGLVASSTGLLRRAAPSKVHTAAQAVSGIVVGALHDVVGALHDVHALATAGPALLPLLGITAVTVILSLGAGLLLARQTGLGLPTASLGMVAGGSAAIVGAAEDLDADSRLVAFCSRRPRTDHRRGRTRWHLSRGWTSVGRSARAAVHGSTPISGMSGHPSPPKGHHG